MPETITLPTGEALIVERNSTTTDRHYVTLWETEDGKPVERLVSVNKQWVGIKGVRVWEPAIIKISFIEFPVEDIPYLKAAIDAAAALATELDAKFPAGTEVLNG